MALTPYGKLVRKLRIDANISLAKMGAITGKHSSYLSMVENGAKKVSKDLIEAAIEMLGEQHRYDIIAAAELSNLKYTGKLSIAIDNLSEDKLTLAIAFAEIIPILSNDGIAYLASVLNNILPPEHRYQPHDSISIQQIPQGCTP